MSITRAATRRGSGFGLAVPAILLLLAFFVVPVALLLLRSVTEPEPGLHNYRALIGSATYAKVFFNTFFVAGVGVNTLPLQIYSMIKVAVSPEVNAISTLLMALTLTLIAIASRLAPDALKVKA